MVVEGQEEDIKAATTSQTTTQEEEVVVAVVETTGTSKIMKAEAEGWAEATGAMTKEACLSSAAIRPQT